MMAKVFGMTVVVSLFLIPGVISQLCYVQPNCAGDSFTASSARECCAGTNDGMSFSDSSGTCTFSQCVVHGFANAFYDVEEGERLDTVFQMNVKGTTNFPNLLLGGTITSAAGPNTRTTDFEALSATNVYFRPGQPNSVDIQLFTSNDDITLEYDDSVVLIFTPSFPGIIQALENGGEFLRTTATVNIDDNDDLEINFEESGYTITEGGNPPRPVIRLLFRRTGNPFTVMLSPVAFSVAKDPAGLNLSAFLTAEEFNEATAADDFTNVTFTITIPATENETTGRFVVPELFNVVDDDIDEFGQSFALVGQLGSDVPDNFTCFQRFVGDPLCFGRTGATQIIIVDDDVMVIGFRERRQSLNETDIQLTLRVSSLRFSEWHYKVQFRHLESRGTATVESSTLPLRSFDAQFGAREDPNDINDPLEANDFVLSGTLMLRNPLRTQVVDDFLPEEDECYTIRILNPYSTPRPYFDCKVDETNPTDYFCLHTICILNDDDPFEVGYVQTTYTVIEDEGPVTVCVELTRPQEDIGEEMVFVEAFDFASSVYIPAGVELATPDPLNPLTGMYDMIPFSDYEQPVLRFNRIRNTVINATQTTICYDQPIYDDMRLEVSEYFGLTLSVQSIPPTTVLTNIRPMYDQAAIRILDDDRAAVVGLERTFYSVQEDVGVVEVCAIVYEPTIDCPIEFPFAVSLSPTDNTAVDPTDYIELSTFLNFGACDTRVCVNVTIMDDLVDEPDEEFDVTLERTPGLDSRISLRPVDARVIIFDDDGKPVMVFIKPENATTLKVKWNGSHFPIKVQYQSHFNATGSLISWHTSILSANVTSFEIDVDDRRPGYQHTFLLQYIVPGVDTPITTASFTFDKKYFQIQFGLMEYCLSWELETRKRIETQLKFYITRVIHEQCTNCTEFSESFLRRGMFVCHTNPTTVTYRSTLVNPFPTNSAHSSYLLDIIENWVITSPSLSLDWLLVRVNPNCTTDIDSLDVAECVSGDTFLPDVSVTERIGNILNVCAVRQLGADICNV